MPSAGSTPFSPSLSPTSPLPPPAAPFLLERFAINFAKPERALDWSRRDFAVLRTKDRVGEVVVPRIPSTNAQVWGGKGQGGRNGSETAADKSTGEVNRIKISFFFF